MRIMIIVIALLVSANLSAKTVLNVKFPETKTIDKQKLVLNGIGIRKATIFAVKVYVGALYMEKKSQKAKEFLNFKGPKYIEMHFVRDVTKEQMIDGWTDAFNDALDEKLNPFKKKIDQFNSYMENMSEKDSILITFSDKGVKTVLKGKEKSFIQGADFAKALLSVWFINASDEGLRDGLLGI